MVLALVTASCGSPDPALVRAEALMEQEPDSALSILEAVDTASLRSERSRALYGLLLTQARVKCDVPVKSDSLIAASARYFASNGPDSLTMRAMFYKAWTNFTLEKYPDAIVPASNSYDLALKSEDNYWIAKSAELISLLYSATFYKEECIKYAWIAAKYYEKASRRLNHIYSLCDLGLALANADSIENGEHLLDSVFDVAMNECADTSTALYALSNIFASKIYAEDYKGAKNIIDTLESFGYSFNNQELGWIALTELKLGNPPDITPLLQLSVKDDISIDESSSLFSFLSNYYRAVGNTNLALRYTDSLLSHQNRMVNELVQQSLVSVLNESNVNKITKEQEKASKLAQTNRFIIIFGVLGTVFILLLWFYRSRLKNAEIRIAVKEIAELSKDNKRLYAHSESLQKALKSKQDALDFFEIEIGKLNSRINNDAETRNKLMEQTHELFKKQWSVINNLCDSFFECESNTVQKNLLRKINQELSSFTDKKNLKKLEQTVNTHYNNIISLLHEQCPWIKDDDFKFILLVAAGFSPRAVNYFCEIKLKYLYNKKTRLADRIKKSSAVNRDDFVKILD